MSEPPLQPPATSEETHVLEIEQTWVELDDEPLEAALAELQRLASSASLRYGYQRKAQLLAGIDRRSVYRCALRPG